VGSNEFRELLRTPHLADGIEHYNAVGAIEGGEQLFCFRGELALIVSRFGILELRDFNWDKPTYPRDKITGNSGKAVISRPSNPDDAQFQVRCPISSFTSRRFPARHSLSRS